MRSGVSVVIPVFNGARYLGEAIESVLAQSVAADDIIVVDDGSEDATPEVARRYADHIRYLRRAHEGAAPARNAGQALVTTPYLAFLDADDVWLPRKLELQLAHLQPRTLVFGHVEQFISPELPEAEAAKIVCDTKPAPFRCCSSMLLHNADFSLGGGFDAGLAVAEFMGWYARMTAAGVQAVMLPDIVFRRRLHTGNMGRRLQHARTDYARAMKAVLDLKRART